MFRSKNLQRAIFGLMAAGLLLVASSSARANPALYKNTMPAMTWVISAIDANHAAMGTGVVVAFPDNPELADRPVIVTAYHVVGDRPNAMLFFPVMQDGHYVTDATYYQKNLDKLGVRARVIAADPRRDLAVLRVERLPAGVKALPLGPASPATGELVHVVGNSRAYDETLWRYREAKVTSVARHRVVYNDKGQSAQSSAKDGESSQEVDALMIDLEGDMDHGDSGGPVLNSRGDVIAINHSSNHDGFVAHSIDVTEIRAVLATTHYDPPAEAPGTAAERERLAREFVTTVDQLADILSGVTDEDSAMLVKVSLRDVVRRLNDLARQAVQLGTPAGDEAKQLKERYESQFKAAAAKLEREVTRVKAIPAAEHVLGEALKALAG